MYELLTWKLLIHDRIEEIKVRRTDVFDWWLTVFFHNGCSEGQI